MNHSPIPVFIRLGDEMYNIADIRRVKVYRSPGSPNFIIKLKFGKDDFESIHGKIDDPDETVREKVLADVIKEIEGILVKTRNTYGIKNPLIIYSK